MLTAVDFAIGPSFDVVLQSSRSSRDELNVLLHAYEPRVVLSYKREARPDLKERSRNRADSVLVCSMKECLQPQRDLKEAFALIRNMNSDS